MKTIVFGVSAFITLLIAMYYRKQQTIKKKISLEYMERPQLNVVPENVTSHLIQTLEKLSRTFDSRIEPEMRKYRLLIDSGQRNTATYPLPTDYQLQVPETIYGMDKISLEKAVFPMTIDLINSHSAEFTITCIWDGGTFTPLTLVCTTITPAGVGASTGVITFTAPADRPPVVGETFVVAGLSNSDYDGTYLVTGGITGTTFSFSKSAPVMTAGALVEAFQAVLSTTADATSTYTSTIPTGNYTITTLATAFQTALNAAATGEAGMSTDAVFTVTIDSTSLIMTITNTVAPVLSFTGSVVATSASISAASSSAYFRAITGLPSVAGPDTATPSPGAALVGTAPVNVGSPCNLLVFLDNKSFDFNSLRIMKSAEIDSRCFANFGMPSGNGVYGGTPSVGTVNGDAILVQGTSGVSGLGSYTITKDMTNAYYKAYEGAIPSVRFINVKIRQLLPDGTTVIPDFNDGNHSMEFEMKARVDKISATFK